MIYFGAKAWPFSLIISHALTAFSNYNRNLADLGNFSALMAYGFIFRIKLLSRNVKINWVINCSGTWLTGSLLGDFLGP